MRFVKDTSACEWCKDCPVEDFLKKDIFPNVTDIHLRARLVSQMAVMDTKWSCSFDPPKKTHRLGDFVESLWCHSQPIRISLEWPGFWKPDRWMINSFQDSYFYLNEGLSFVLLTLVEQAHLKKIELQVEVNDLTNVYIDPSRPFEAAEHAEFSYHVHPGTEIDTTACLRKVWLHYAKNYYWKQYSKVPSKYCLPPLRDYEEGIEQLCMEVEADDMERFESFKKKLGINNKTEEDTQTSRV
ncbi:hypothetical protein I302_103214 [Kwoniella bestiolae CBS 10118]|uniref:F-box domain-containing protein n=1 Tax=Kwoniella bestiolae CBS 10118 TaxID=1296100 RepID=A0A1B9G7S9_9TREE|nr:hypothetical protein I302_01913 [Kwoniella bestiolae CBS 10118]OCF27078.1 hypothetical protein I302_01913 [Kwoniella bestiolae CBS 10118]